MPDAWRYVTTDPEAALTAHATIELAQTQENPEQFGTVPDWNAVRRELRD